VFRHDGPLLGQTGLEVAVGVALPVFAGVGAAAATPDAQVTHGGVVETIVEIQEVFNLRHATVAGDRGVADIIEGRLDARGIEGEAPVVGDLRVQFGFVTFGHQFAGEAE